MSDVTNMDPFAGDVNKQDQEAIPAPPAIQGGAIDISTLANSMINYDQTATTTQELRRAFVNKFMPDVLNLDMRVDASTDAKQFEAQTRFMEVFRQTLNDMESSAKNHIGMKLKQKDIEQQQEGNINAAELLAAIKLNNTILTKQVEQHADDIEKELQHEFEASGAEILDTELEIGGNRLPVHGNEDEDEEKK